MQEEIAMELYATHYQGRTIITVLRMIGKLDALSYLDLIEKVKQVFGQGTRQVVLDLSGVAYISSAGLMALHYAATLLRGAAPTEPEAGWGALHAFADEAPGEMQRNLKLLNPQPQIRQTLERVKFTTFLDVYSSLDDAISSFSPLADQSGAAERRERYIQSFKNEPPTT